MHEQGGLLHEGWPVATDDVVFGPGIVKGQCVCQVCGQLIFGADAALTKWAEPVDLWVHFIEPDDNHEAVFGTWHPKD